MNKLIYGDPIWEELFKDGWGKYPPEEVVRFYFRMVKSNFEKPKVLDVGAGQGACSWFMTKEGAAVTAFDGSPTGLSNIKKLAESFGVINSIDIILGDIVNPIKYIHNEFDVILDNYSLCSNEENKIYNALKYYFTLLKKDGVMMMNCFGENMDGSRTGTQLSENTFRDVDSGSLKNRGVVTWYTRCRLNDLLHDIGFKVLHTEDAVINDNGVVHEKIITYIIK